MRRPLRCTLFPYTTLFRSIFAAEGLTKRSAVGFLLRSKKPTALRLVNRSEERFSRNAETDLVCRLLPEKKKRRHTVTLPPPRHSMRTTTHFAPPAARRRPA